MPIHVKVRKAPAGGWSNPIGTHDAICVDVVFAPRQHTAYGDQDFIYLVFANSKGELSHKRFPATLSQGTQLDQALTGWRGGRPIDDPESFDLENLVGVRATIRNSRPPGAEWAQVEIGMPTKSNSLTLEAVNYTRPDWLAEKAGAPQFAHDPLLDDDVPF